MSKEFIVADWSNFQKYGGVEKNGHLLTKDISGGKYDVIILRNKYDYILILLKIISRKIIIKAFLCFKNSAFIGLIMHFLGIRIVMRVNNSPESYLYWLKAN